MSRNSEYFFHNAGRVAWFMKWRIYAKLLFWGFVIGSSLLEGVYCAIRH